MSRHAGFVVRASDVAQLAIPIDARTRLLIGLETLGLPATATDVELVRQAASCIGSWLAQPRPPAPMVDQRLDVSALGSLRAERAGTRVEQWGGQKAGTRQALGIFGFLFDRGERGVHKDEIVALIWPEVALERADLAFHRTLGGLRRALMPEGRPGEAISFRNDRYYLRSDVVRGSDVGEFEWHIDAACVARDPDAVRLHLEQARRLYRGDYLGDCPFYGDSAFVEDRRQLLRGRYLDVLMALANIHERSGNRLAAAGLFREALGNGDYFPPAEHGLLPIQVSA
jgi:two-component SAPR family response regulator